VASKVVVGLVARCLCESLTVEGNFTCPPTLGPDRENEDPVTLPPLRSLEQAAKRAASWHLDHLPLLITDRCLSDSHGIVARHVVATFPSSDLFASEVITMPRRGFGPRPIAVLAPTTRTLYESLVMALEPALPPRSRGKGKWAAHKAFGNEGTHSHVVELDIAACDEYLDHAVLCDELLLRSTDAATVDALRLLLSHVASHGRGLPQMLSASDALADAYLSILDRSLLRQGCELHRYADDTRVLASDWEGANRIVEQYAEYCRHLGLILSSHKTRIYRKPVKEAPDHPDDQLLNSYFRKARTALTKLIDTQEGPYQEAAAVLVEPAEKDVILAGAQRLLMDWQKAAAKDAPDTPRDAASERFIPQALRLLEEAAELLPAKLLTDIVFRAPSRLEQVCEYLIVRGQTRQGQTGVAWASVHGLTQMGRQSPWAKLWLLNTVEQLAAEAEPPPEGVLGWVIAQIADRHETVRAQAAWTLACVDRLSEDSLLQAYRQASQLSRPALAACSSRQQDIRTSIRMGITSESPLTGAAGRWAHT